MSDGKTYDITNHDMMLLTRNSVYIGVAQDADDIAERLVQCAILHITSIEDLGTTAPKRRKTPKS